ncbi:MAG: hypothetical protein U1A78_35340 [Polyangia bacterium]
MRSPLLFAMSVAVALSIAPQSGRAQAPPAAPAAAPVAPAAPAASAPPAAPTPAPVAATLIEPPPGPDPSLVRREQLDATLQLLLRRGLITQAEYEDASAGRIRPQPAGAPPSTPPGGLSLPLPGVLSKWDATLYGFVEADTILDTTQSLGELAGGTVIARPGTYAGDHGRITFTVRNSRLGFRLKAPEFHRVKVSATLEMDFLGNQPPQVSELATFTFPTFRIRHYMAQIETPYISLLAGQYWQLFGWQPYFHPSTVAIQGVPGQIYSRTPQLRLFHVFRTAPVNIELAGALARAPQRDSMVPDGQAGLRLTFNKWRGLRTVSATGTAIDGAAVGLSGALRYFSLPEFAAMPQSAQSTYGWGVSVDAMLPIIPVTERRAGALTVTGSFVRGTGIADYYVMQTGGVSNPALPLGQAFTADIDNGLALYSRAPGGGAGPLGTVDWQSFMVGAQLYLPPRGLLFLSSNYSQMDSDNAADFGAANQVYNQSRWADVNLFFDPTPSLRLGLEYAWFQQTYVDGVTTQNHRGWLSVLFLF